MASPSKSPGALDADHAFEEPGKPLGELIEELVQGRGARFSGFKGSARSYTLAWAHHQSPGASLIILPDARELEGFRNEISFFLAERNVPDPVLVFPPWPELPFDDVPPHPEVVGERLQTLLALPTAKRPVILTTWEAVLHGTITPERLHRAALALKTGMTAGLRESVAHLTACGYSRATQVEDPGDMAVRGGILDIFPVGADTPVRFEFVGDTIESVRRFDPSSQISLRVVAGDEVVRIPPARESIIFAGEVETVAEGLRNLGADVTLAHSSLEVILESLRTRGTFAFQDYLLQAVLPRATFFDHLAAPTTVWMVDKERGLGGTEALLAEARTRYKQLLDDEKLVPPVESFYLGRQEIEKLAIGNRHAQLESLQLHGDAGHVATTDNGDWGAEVKQAGGLGPLVKRLGKWYSQGGRTTLTAKTRGGVERLTELLAPYESTIGERISVVQAPLARGFRIPGEGIAYITEEDIFGLRTRHAAPARLKKEKFTAALRELKEGDFVVHVKHGVGKYLGLHTRTVAGETGDFFLLEYQGGDRLYLPVYRLEGIQKYIGSEGTAPRLDKLGGQGWEKTKKKVKEAVLAMAADLLELYAAREVVSGHAFSPPGHLYQEFEATFEYDETPDQAQAISDTLGDMMKPRPMDRLVCGDVGYGKTEVAMRAAFKAVEDGKQVAVLVPTTILAFQHLNTFRERFDAFPAKVEMLSRFVSPAQQKDTLVKLRRGEVDVIIGTHRLLQGDIDFKDLGLLVIDEEHRFGVKHKEKIKQLKKAVDVLTLTATPIPRTLHLSILGLRDLSIIATPPRDRLSIRTFVTPFDEPVLQEAIQRELRRQGQIFFIHNRIDSIHAMAEEVKRLVPEIRLRVAHGRMNEHELEEIMLGFLKHDFDMLLCTTIVESGIDIPTANTMIINRADRFGLAELYQLRGRVGRSHQRAYAYLVIDSESSLSNEARQRLDVIQSFADLGAGFKIAAHDLEIRGAGEILGKNQSGQIAAVGFDLYSTLLEQATQELRGEKYIERPEPDLNIHFSAYIPEAYVPDVTQRLDFYQRLSRLIHEDDADALRLELTDRYGEPTEETDNLIEVSRLKVMLRELVVRSIDITQDKAVIRFDPDTPLLPEKLVALVAKKPKEVRFLGEDKIAFAFTAQTPVEALRALLRSLRELVGFARI